MDSGLAGFTPEQLDAVIAESLRNQLAAGVTTVRDLGDQQWSVVAWRDRARAGKLGFASPTILASGPPVTIRQGHCWAMGGVATGPKELRAAVRERAERGVDVVKIMASGGFLTPGTDVMACQFALEEIRLVVDEAHALGLGVTAHAHGLSAVEQAVEAGVDGIEHCTCVTANGYDISDSLIERLARSNIAICPTLGTVPGNESSAPPELIALHQRLGMTPEKRKNLIGAMHRGGAVIVSGGDSGIGPAKPHGVLPISIAELVAGGVSPSDALASATSVAARVAGLGKSKGRLAPGYDADVVVVAGDPFTDMSALAAVQGVVLGGVLMDVPGGRAIW